MFPNKGVDRLFDIVDPDSSHIVIMGGLFRESDIRVIPRSWRREMILYQESIKRLSESDRRKGKVTMTGFLPPREAAGVLAAADAVVLPFLEGKNASNTSVYAAQAQGTFVLTTSKELTGYHPDENTFYTAPLDLESMQAALKQYAGKRLGHGNAPEHAWRSIRDTQMELYRLHVLPKPR
jgi:alpha-acetolactate decarboxylase